MADDNKSLARFILDVTPAPRGMPQIEVTFDVDANGILSVKAKDKGTGKEQSVRIEARSGLTDADIEKMKRDAEAHGAEDLKKKETAEARNSAEQLVYMAEKSLKDNAGKIPEDITKDVEAKIAELKGIKDTGEAASIKSATDALSTSVQKMGEHVYKQGGTPGGETPPKPSDSDDPNDGNVRDADFKEKPEHVTPKN
jgi:molecular chaperone DnaK